MNASIWLLLLVVCAAGAIGGLVNALLSDNGFFLPATKQAGDLTILQPGFLGNMLIGLVAAGISWGLYGPLGTAPVFGAMPASESFTLSALIGAVLVGMGGARWITNIVDKKLLTVAASKAAAAPAAPERALQMLAASPAQVLSIAEKLKA
ncbi:MAG TPA: hypothetical protein VKP04_00780 [Ktedonobacteraceae bacterium]|nr:hypothetical protein [Ktedonobacteraceae bacterium]